MNIIGLDIGGANIKAAHVDGFARSRRFDLWKHPQQLSAELAQLLDGFPVRDLLAVTMTAELADCFRTKAEGVDAVLCAVEQAAGSTPIYVWQTAGEFVSPDVARAFPRLTAAANWHATATWAGRMVPRSAAVLIDVGTTTTDIIPLLDGVPVPTGLTDVERLQAGELVYTGVRRTPLCAIAHTVPFRDGYCPLAAELFATTLDVYLTLGWIPEDPNDDGTADGRPATIAAAHDRLARMLCCDRTEFDAADARLLARFLADVQHKRIAGPLERVLARFERPCEAVVIAGSGEFLARQLASGHSRLQGAEILSLTDALGPDISTAACAVAVARLAEERL
jgi:(4-(4-[2-(gamma-L-glutamylamino)ethyl]phenoxymethyl)furan-2-yl)methanamine synthase